MKLFVSCVSKKHGEIKADVSKIKADNHEDFLKEWLDIREGNTPARDVYKGAQWEIIKKLENKAEVYVVSAGYGRLRLDDNITPYSITFSSAYPENNHLLIPQFDGLNQKQTNQRWWGSMVSHDKVDIEYDPNESYVFTTNPCYNSAMAVDLKLFEGKDNYLKLTDYRLGRLAKWLKTGANNLNVTFAKWLIENEPNIKTNTELKILIEDLDKKHGKDLYKKRSKVDDAFIYDWIEQNKTIQQLRDNNYSCSKQRFNNLKQLR